MTNALLFNRYTSHLDLADHLKQDLLGQEIVGQDKALESIAAAVAHPFLPRLLPLISLVGKPFSGKTSIVRSVAKAIGADLLYIDALQTGELGQALRETFASSASDKKPLVIGLDRARYLSLKGHNTLISLIHKDTDYPAPEIAAVFLVDDNTPVPAHLVSAQPQFLALGDRTTWVRLTERKP